MIRKRMTGLLMVSVLLLGSCATIEKKWMTARIQKDLPSSFSGTFNWQNDPYGETQYINIFIQETAEDSRGGVLASGTGVYSTSSGKTEIGVKIHIVPETLGFEMWEFDARGSSDFITGGSHRGVISEDLKTIEAVWTTSDTGDKGDLYLEMN